MNKPVVLTIAGTDPTSGAGLQADIRTISALESYPVSVVTALVAQNTKGVTLVESVSPQVVRAQLEAIAADCYISAVKIGMLGSAHIAREVHSWLRALRQTKRPRVVLDPVLVATSGHALSADEDQSDVIRAILDLAQDADLVTPNLPELARLLDTPDALTEHEMASQGRALARLLGTSVLVKGGHLTGPVAMDILISSELVSSSRCIPDNVEHALAELCFTQPRINTNRTHGTGCALSSAIAAQLAHADGDIAAAVHGAREWLQAAIAGADHLAFGQGNGPIDHSVTHTEIRINRGVYQWKEDDLGTAPGRENENNEGRRELDVWWAESESIRNETNELEFVRMLGLGTLPRERFLTYLVQDAQYLRHYSRALAIASTLADQVQEQQFWAAASANTLVAERQLHEQWLSSFGDVVPSWEILPDAARYFDHLDAVSCGRSYLELVAAVLPCYWMYRDIGVQLDSHFNYQGHPYEEWLKAYSDPKFARSTRAAIQIVSKAIGRALRAGHSEQLAAAKQAFLTSCEMERDFFACAVSAVDVPPVATSTAATSPALKATAADVTR